MKKTIAVLFAVLSTAVFAGADDVLITFSTPGPDKYADGTDVLENERYALVWTPAEGEQKIVLAYPGAKKIDNADGMHCPPVLFIVDEKDAQNYKNGTWGVYLLDTRNYKNGADGTSLATVFDEKAVNVKAPVAEGIVSAAKMESAANGAVAAGSYDIPKPTVTGIKVEGAKVFITIKDIVPCFEYTVKSGSNVQAEFVLPKEGEVSSEMAASAKEITLTVDKQEGAQFFRVTTK